MTGDRPPRVPPRTDSEPPGAALRRVPCADETPDSSVHYVDGEWVHWSVVEVDATAVPGALGARCLVFARDGCIRRVWDYPADWRTYDDAGLAALSWRR